MNNNRRDYSKVCTLKIIQMTKFPKKFERYDDIILKMDNGIGLKSISEGFSARGSEIWSTNCEIQNGESNVMLKTVNIFEF